MTRKVTGVVMVAALWAGSVSLAQTASDSLGRGFVTPPESAKPRTWWHWTNGNVTEDGMTKDLEWMERSGIGGFQLVEGSAYDVRRVRSLCQQRAGDQGCYRQPAENCSKTRHQASSSPEASLPV